jgi:hypothetical protein
MKGRVVSMRRSQYSRAMVVIGLAVFFLLTLGATSARADISVYTINSSLTYLAGSPWAQVTVDRTSSTTANITFDALTGYSFFDQNEVGVNVNATSFSESNLNDTLFSMTRSVTVTPIQFYIGGSLDGVGPMNVVVGHSSNTDLPGNRATEITFTVTDLDPGSDWLSSAQVLKPVTSSGRTYSVGAHITSDTSKTEDATTVPSPNTYAFNTVPEPTSIALFGGVLLVVSAVRRRWPAR